MEQISAHPSLGIFAPTSWLLAIYDPHGCGKCGKGKEQFSARPSLDIFAPTSWLLAIYDPHGCGKCGKCKEQFSARPSLDIFAPPSWLLAIYRPSLGIRHIASLAPCVIPPIPGHKKAETGVSALGYYLPGSF